MTSYDVKRLALIQAKVIEVEGMKAANRVKWFEYEELVYDSAAFQEKSDEMYNLAYQPEDTL